VATSLISWASNAEIVYSLLNSLTLIACRVATPRTLCWLSAMIFSATRRVAGSSTTFNPSELQTLSSASDISRIVSGSNDARNFGSVVRRSGVVKALGT